MGQVLRSGQALKKRLPKRLPGLPSLPGVDGMTALRDASGDPAFCSQANFARLIEREPSYVTKLKQQGRLVCTEAGQVDVVASLARVKATSGAPERAAPAVQGSEYHDASDRDKHYSAELKRLEYERGIKAVLEAPDVLSVIADVATTLRARFEAWPDRLTPQIAALAGDEHRIRALLSEQVQAAFAELARGFERVTADAA